VPGRPGQAARWWRPPSRRGRTPAAPAAAGVAFARWEELIADALGRRGIAPERAGSIATLTIAAIAGAVIVARAQRSSAPLERVVGELERVVTDAIALG
jgi:TetR/AcrR family transcriptional repressor of lmrAB and yxaGH operons